MSKKLRDFIELLSKDVERRDDVDVGSYVTWLRRRIILLRNIDTLPVKQIIRHASHEQCSRDDLLVKQGKQRDSSEHLRFFVILRGSVSIYVNPLKMQGEPRRRSNSSFEHVLYAASLGDRYLGEPRLASGASRRTSQSVVSQPYGALTEHSESDASDSDSNSINGKKTPLEKVDTVNTEKSEEDSATPGESRLDLENVSREQTATPKSKTSKASKGSRRTIRGKLGNFVVKYEKGKYFDEESLLDVDGVYNATVVVDEDSDLMLLNEDIFNEFVKEHHEKEATTMSNFVDLHPFFSSLPLHTRGVLQISLKNEHYEAGKYIVKQGDHIHKLAFLVSGSAEVIIEPSQHKSQYPDYWPFEANSDVYYKECDWLRESRKRFYSRKYEYAGEVSRRTAREAVGKRPEISVCAVQNREVIGITEIMLKLHTHMSSLRCLHDCDVYTLSLKPFRRTVKRFPNIGDMIWSYIHMKLQYRLDNSLGDQVPLLYALKVLVERKIREKTTRAAVTLNVERMRQREHEMLELLGWFKQDKSSLAPHFDPKAIGYKERMKDKARLRKSIRDRTVEFGSPHKQYVRTGCMAAIKIDREPRSLLQLRDPLCELMLKLRMEGTFVSSQKELEEMIMRFSVTPAFIDYDVSQQASRVVDEEYNLLRYRRHGNRLVTNFAKMLAKRDPRMLLKEKNDHSILMEDSALSDGDELDDIPEEEYMFERFNQAFTSTRPPTFATIHRSRPTTFRTQKSRPTTNKSMASTNTYKTLQFDRRSVTPNTLDHRIRAFHFKYGGTESEVDQLPIMKNHRDVEINPEEPPMPGGKVFVTTLPCVSCKKNVLLKNHTHIRCQMLHELPMNKVKGDPPF
ncbi:uncharacterized protein LOC128237432 isoform X2 [Mya arenaria]|uniref:uncharacterized protein LOC128237432 isoform X2 n=1 Tax=Mya arenaria TaxID=6604 RepID=UPI0022E48FD8|nr:uncharacterized protein LOC128237432 isoform X2 [Mya arenaria]